MVFHTEAIMATQNGGGVRSLFHSMDGVVGALIWRPLGKPPKTERKTVLPLKFAPKVLELQMTTLL